MGLFDKTTNPFKYEMGAEVTDKITGYKGTITSQHLYINGCVSYGVERLEQGDIKSWSIDEERISFISQGLSLEAKPSGGPHTPPAAAGR